MKIKLLVSSAIKFDTSDKLLKIKPLFLNCSPKTSPSIFLKELYKLNEPHDSNWDSMYAF